MKRHTLMAALLAGCSSFACAQSSVTIYGVADAGLVVGNTRVDNMVEFQSACYAGWAADVAYGAGESARARMRLDVTNVVLANVTCARCR